MNRVIFAPQAEIDLLDIARHIAAGSLTAAYAFIDAIQQKCELLAANPEMGRLRGELTSQLRSFPVGGYVMIYRAQGVQPIQHRTRGVRRKGPASGAATSAWRASGYGTSAASTFTIEC